MGEAWFAHQPACPVHGQMRREAAAGRWACADGDCDQAVSDLEIPWRSLGTVTAGEWRVPFIVTSRDRVPYRWAGR